jgi:pyruvate/2-oxoglutarate dehydrogenase complex dihydrolipoamide acyltransferase (E2) component
VTRIVPFTKNRQVIHDLMTRARDRHCSVSTCWELDVETLYEARRAVKVDGRQLSMTACIVKATSLLLEKHPRFNRHLFHGLFKKYVVEFDVINCTLIVMRKAADGERILFPLLIKGANELSVVEIQTIIDQTKYGKIEDLPQLQMMERVKRMPRLALSWFNYKTRSDQRFYLEHFGTFGISQMAAGSFGPLGGHTVANTAAAFLIGPLDDRPHVRRKEIVIKKTLGMMLVADHYVLDGIDMLEGMRTLGKIFKDPSKLGIEPLT